MSALSNAELMLLQIVMERPKVSGYEINQLVEERGYREWANIGTTSIYNSLDKLRKKDFLESFLDTGKTGRGPAPRRFRVTSEGVAVLRQEVMDALSGSRERDHRFDLGLAGSWVLDKESIRQALRQRREFLDKVAAGLENKYSRQGGKNLPFHVQALFDHPVLLITREIEFVDSLLKQLVDEE